VHTDEVCFCATAQGFLAWAVATLATAALVTPVVGSIVSGGAQTGAALADGAGSTAAAMSSGATAPSSTSQGGDGGPMGYFVDSLFRREPGAAAAASDASPGAAGASEAAKRSRPATRPTRRARHRLTRHSGSSFRC